jgi:hypothetical protein
LCLTDLNADPGDPKTYGFGSFFVEAQMPTFSSLFSSPFGVTILFFSLLTPNDTNFIRLKHRTLSVIYFKNAKYQLVKSTVLSTRQVDEKKYMGHHLKSRFSRATFFFKNSTNTEHFFQQVSMTRNSHKSIKIKTRY